MSASSRAPSIYTAVEDLEGYPERMTMKLPPLPRQRGQKTVPTGSSPRSPSSPLATTSSTSRLTGFTPTSGANHSFAIPLSPLQTDTISSQMTRSAPRGFVANKEIAWGPTRSKLTFPWVEYMTREVLVEWERQVSEGVSRCLACMTSDGQPAVAVYVPSRARQFTEPNTGIVFPSHLWQGLEPELIFYAGIWTEEADTLTTASPSKFSREFSRLKRRAGTWFHGDVTETVRSKTAPRSSTA